MSVAGSKWHIGGSPSLAHLIKQTALDVPHPTIKGKTLWDARDDEGPFTGIGDESAGKSNSTGDTDFMALYEAAEKERQASKTGISALGSGSDYTVFLQRLGVSCSNSLCMLGGLRVASNRLRVQIKALEVPRLMPFIITIRFMTARGGRKPMRILGSSDM